MISPVHYQRVTRAITDFLNDQLGALTVGLFVPEIIDGVDGMRTAWSYPQFPVYETLKSEQVYRRQLTMAMGERRNLWIISENDQPLTEVNRGVDVWHDPDTHLPTFYSSHDHLLMALENRA